MQIGLFQYMPASISCIIPPTQGKGGLYLGNIGSLIHSRTDNQIEAVVTVMKINLQEIQHTIKYHLQIEVEDMDKENLLEYFDKAVNFIQQAMKDTNVLVHCMAGISRSTTIVIAYLMKVHKMTYQQGLQNVLQKREFVYPNDGFRKQLVEYENQLKKVSLKTGGEQVRSSGYTLRLAMRIERNLVFNYDLGRLTSTLRYCLAPFLLPALIRHSKQIQSSYHAQQLIITTLDLMCLLDVINTSEHQQRHCILYFIRIIRTITLIIQFIQSLIKLIQRHYHAIITTMSTNKNTSNYNNDKITNNNGQNNTTNVTTTTTNNNNNNNNITSELVQVTDSIPGVVQHNTHNNKLRKSMKIPPIQVIIAFQHSRHELIILNWEQFEQQFNTIPISDQRYGSRLKLYMCCKIHQRLKQSKANPKEIQAYRLLINKYFTSMLHF